MLAVALFEAGSGPFSLMSPGWRNDCAACLAALGVVCLVFAIHHIRRAPDHSRHGRLPK